MALFVLASKDGWVNIMYTGLDAVDVDQQVSEAFWDWAGNKDSAFGRMVEHNMGCNGVIECKWCNVVKVFFFSLFTFISVLFMLAMFHF